MLEQLKERAAAAVELSKRAGADEAWAVASQSRDVEFNYRDGALEKVKDTTSRQLAIQIYANDRYSSHQTTDLHPDRLQDFLTEAVAITGALEPDTHRQIPPPELYADRPEDNLDLVDGRVAELDREQRLAWCVALDDTSRKHDRVVSATAGVYDGTVASATVGSNGFAGANQSTYCWLGSNITLMDEGDKRASDSFYAGATHVASLPNATAIATTALERSVARLGSDKGPTVKSTMVVDSRAATQLVSRLLRSANAASVQQGRSFWANILGKPTFSDLLSIVDDPLIPHGLASRTFDNEGISARPITLVESGVAQNIYVDTYYGRKSSMTPTTGTPSNRRVATGEQSLVELLNDAGEGIYVTSWLGGNADATTGDFSLGLRGHLIENGQVGQPVGEMNVTGNLLSLFQRLAAVGNDPYPYSTTLAPSMVFSDVDFSGA